MPPPAAADAAIGQANALAQSGRYAAALALIARAIETRPNDPELQFARATTLFDWGRVREARAWFLRAAAAGMQRTALHLNLAWSSHLLGLPEKAERHIRQAIASDPASVSGHFGLGAVLQRLGRFPEAIQSFERALELSPGYVECLASIATCKLEQRDYAGSETWARRAIAAAPERPQAWNTLGVALANQERYAEALEALQRAGAAELASGSPIESIVDHGFAMILTGQNEAAAQLYRKELPRVPNPSAHGHYAFALLSLGQFREGWQQYEFRWLQDSHLAHRPQFAQPVWAGQSLVGKTLLLRAEQGFGDIIQFARFAPAFKAMGATVVLQVRSEVTELARGFAGVDHVFAPPTPAPPFDYYLHLMGIPHALGIELDTIPAPVSYLRTTPRKVAEWAARISDPELKVGLVWSGNPAHTRDRHRSIPFERLTPLWAVQGVRYFSLQKQPKPSDVEQYPPAPTMHDCGPEFKDFEDTAAVIANLDLVICVDTAIAHLAGALGKPVWLMLPAIGDFRWIHGQEGSPWYPSMRLFWQRRLDEWDDVIARVRGALEDAIRARATGEWSQPLPLAALGPVAPAAQHPIPATADADESPDIARVVETRYGIIQYLPGTDRMARSLAWYGEYLQPQLDLIQRLLPTGAHALEAGCGIGGHAVQLARWVGDNGQLFLFETRPLVRRLLQQNLQANQVLTGVTMMRRALAGPDATGEDRGMEGDEIATDSIKQHSDTIDDLLLERLDLIKIQAGEPTSAILAGARESLWRLRPRIFAEALDEADLVNLGGFLQAFGYRCWRFACPLFTPSNFNRRDRDIFEGQVSLALLAIPEEADVAIDVHACEGLSELRAATMSDGMRAPDREPAPATSPPAKGDKPGVLGRLKRLWR
jgi:tetratricopeptide (TPR) repeat protein